MLQNNGSIMHLRLVSYLINLSLKIIASKQGYFVKYLSPHLLSACVCP